MHRDQISINKAELSDAEWIARCQVKMAKETESIELNYETIVKGVSYTFEHPDQGFYVIAKNQEQQPVGELLILKEWSDWRNGEIWWIHSVYVVPELRGQKIFTRMFRFVEDLARQNKARGLRLYVERANDRAQQVYLNLGMTKDHYEMFEKMF